MAELHKSGNAHPGERASFELLFQELEGFGCTHRDRNLCRLSLNHILHFARKYHRLNPVFSVDAWTFEGADFSSNLPGSDVTFSAYRQHVIDTFERNIRLFSSRNLPHHIALESDAFFDAWSRNEGTVDHFGQSVRLGGPIAFAYIDGAHTYEQSLRDFQNVDRFLEIGGYVIFDDSADGSAWGSHRTATEAAALPRYRLVGKNPNYCLQRIAR
jgi:methyltransferase family protein